MGARPLCYQNVKYKLKDSIHTLSTKAVGFLKISIINLYHRHMPDRDDWDSHKLKNISMLAEFIFSLYLVAPQHTYPCLL